MKEWELEYAMKMAAKESPPPDSIPLTMIFAVDSKGGIGKNGSIPWSFPNDMRRFRAVTMGGVVIMGTNTYYSLPGKGYLKGRYNIVVSTKARERIDPTRPVYFVPTIETSIELARELTKGGEDGCVSVIGGSHIFASFAERYGYMFDSLHITRIEEDYECDVAIDVARILKRLVKAKIHNVEPRFASATITENEPIANDNEYTYLGLMKKIVAEGSVGQNRTGVTTIRLFGGLQAKYDITDGPFVITTRRFAFKSALEELFFFIRGETQTKKLEDKGVCIWKGNTSRAFLDSRGLDYPEGEMGPGYGYQWRRKTDQLANVIESLVSNPHSRQHLICSWAAEDVPKMALPPCHFACQFGVSECGKHLDTILYQRSADMFLGVPFNLFSYSVLAYIVGGLAGLKPRYLHHYIGDGHIYTNHLTQIRMQFQRTPFSPPKVNITIPEARGSIPELLDSLDAHIVEIRDYECWPKLQGVMAV